MKKLKSKSFICFLLLCAVQRVIAQSPQLVPYQAIARDNIGNPVINESIGLRFSIHNQTIDGTIVWQEEQVVVSNNLGIIVTALGGVNSLSIVDWGNGAKFLQVEMDISGGNNYLDMGTQQMMSVPYALYAETSGNLPENGDDGLNSLITQTQELPGSNCPFGGIKIEVGLDINSDGTLSSEEVNTSQTQFICNGETQQNPIEIGDTINGGIVFYVDESGEHGLVALDYDIVDLNAPFFSTVAQFGYTTSTNVGSGKVNTQILANSNPDENSAVNVVSNLVANGFDDWFIPSRDELALMRINLYLQGIGNFVGSSGPQYRSSSYFISYSGCTSIDKWFNYAGTMSISGFMDSSSESNCGGIQTTYRVRPIRAF